MSRRVLLELECISQNGANLSPPQPLHGAMMVTLQGDMRRLLGLMPGQTDVFSVGAHRD